MMKNRLGFVAVLFFIFFTLNSSGWCSASRAKRSAEKFARGATNVISSPLEIGYAFDRSIAKGELYQLFLVTPVRGIAKMVERMSVGAYEVGTFWIPQKPILKPVYLTPTIREYFKEGRDEK